MKIATLQYDIIWEDTNANLDRLDQLIDQLSENVDLIVLPEMFNTGFSMNSSRIASEDGGATLKWMLSVSQKKKCVITGSVAVKIDDHYYNRLYWVQPDGKVYHYDKRHLFRMADEHLHYQAGENQVIVSYKGWRFMLQVCYDLRFPIWSRNTVLINYDALIYVANWPAVRSEAWHSLLKARAIENLSYVVGVNRVGTDGNGIPYDGKSVVFDFKGESIDQHQVNLEGWSIQSLSREALDQFRDKFPAHLDADEFGISI